MEPRAMGPAESLRSCRVGIRWVIFPSRISLFWALSSRFRRTSEMPKSPMTAGTRPTPSRRGGMCRVNLSTPVTTSTPTKPRRSPTHAMIRALIMDPPER